ncbi:hypothetical protein QTG54_009184 [Skeletonema marinoi]|uniref:Phosphoglycerate mutase-like protein n=1 Tax=Skeletonema marinoi TaxID=267567 RepID=A0AAD9DBT4_9STRA|nr:hypothetical protein QTG54_009184 [Skeletonema marinoi]
MRLLRGCYQCLVLHNIIMMKTSSAFASKNILQNTRAAASTTTTTTTSAAKEICETQITSTGTAEVLCTISNEDSRSSLWSEVAINAAKQFTITQRKKLQELGALDVERPVKIVGTSLSENCGLGDCVLEEKKEDGSDMLDNTKIIHFQRHGQGYHNLICDMWRELGKPIDFDSADPNLNPVVRPEFLDPPLTALGMQQCSSQRDLCNSLSPDLVIVSPMLRCIQTAKLSFRDHVSTVPWVSHEGCREELVYWLVTNVDLLQISRQIIPRSTLMILNTMRMCCGMNMVIEGKLSWKSPNGYTSF